MCGFWAKREDIYEEKKMKISTTKNLLKISFKQNLKFSKSIKWFKSYNFFPSMYKKKFKNDQDVCWPARTWLHGDEDDCQRPVHELFPPDP